MSIPRILIIGSGAVGAIYGHYLANAACRVTYLVRDRNSPNAQMPRTLHHYPLIGAPRHQEQYLRVVTLADSSHDQVWLCLPSTALDDPWLAKQLARIGNNTPVILWTPDMRDRERMQKMHSGPVTQALIGLVSFQTPLPGEQTPSAGIGYLAPPRSAVIQSTPDGEDAARWLRQGGLSVTLMRDLPTHTARMTALLQPAIAALEICDWSLAGLRRSHWLGIATDASDEARAIGEHYLGAAPGRRLPGKTLGLRALLWLAPPLSPFPLETYLHYHFAKVGQQTREMFDGWIAQGKQASLPTAALEQLRHALP